MTEAPLSFHVVAIPLASELRSSLHRIDFSDAYEVSLRKSGQSVEQAYWAVFGFEPIWVRWLMNLRGHIAIQLGLTHHRNVPAIPQGVVPIFEIGARVGPFKVQSTSLNELIVGNDDKHLNFRISALKSERAGQIFLTISTAVEIHNNLGRAYMFVVKPFHRFIAPFMVRRAARLGRL